LRSSAKYFSRCFLTYLTWKRYENYTLLGLLLLGLGLLLLPFHGYTSFLVFLVYKFRQLFNTFLKWIISRNFMNELQHIINYINEAKQDLGKTKKIIEQLQNRIEQILNKEKLSTFDLHQLRIFSELLDSINNRENNINNAIIKKIDVLVKYSEQLGISASSLDLNELLKTEKINLFVDKDITDPKTFTEERIKNTIFINNDNEENFTG
jgi:hypothetical protein